MNWKDDARQAGLALIAIAGAIAAHNLVLPPSWVPYAGGIEFTCTAIGIAAAVFVNKPGGTAS